MHLNVLALSPFVCVCVVGSYVVFSNNGTTGSPTKRETHHGTDAIERSNSAADVALNATRAGLEPRARSFTYVVKYRN